MWIGLIVLALAVAVDMRVRRFRDGGLLHNEDGDMSAARLILTPATQAKGLEFDHVIVVEPAAIVAAESRGLRRLYVVLTRAVSRLSIIHAHALPAALD